MNNGVEKIEEPFVDLDLSGKEIWREYDFAGRVYTIYNPVRLIIRERGSTHRVIDAEGVVHCLPGVGTLGCIVRWRPTDPNNPVIR